MQLSRCEPCRTIQMYQMYVCIFAKTFFCHKSMAKIVMIPTQICDLICVYLGFICPSPISQLSNYKLISNYGGKQLGGGDKILKLPMKSKPHKTPY